MLVIGIGSTLPTSLLEGLEGWSLSGKDMSNLRARAILRGPCNAVMPEGRLLM